MCGLPIYVPIDSDSLIGCWGHCTEVFIEERLTLQPESIRAHRVIRNCAILDISKLGIHLLRLTPLLSVKQLHPISTENLL